MDKPEVEQFVRLFSDAEHEIYRYVYSLVPNPDDARDIVQEAAVALWRKFAEYDRNHPFVPWACRFAYYEVLRFRKAHRHWTVHLSEQTIGLLAEDFDRERVELEARRQALIRCVEKLSGSSRQFLEQHYTSGLTIQEIARRTNRSVNTLYKSMRQIRRWLMACIARALNAEASP